VKQTKLQPQFVAIAWEDAGEKGIPVTVRAILCLRHRREIGLQHPTARGWGQFGEGCDLCLRHEVAQPRVRAPIGGTGCRRR